MENAGNAESEAEKERGDKTLYRSLIDQVILVGLDRHCRTCPDRHQLRWITSLSVVGRRQWEAESEQAQEGSGWKFVQLGNDLFLKAVFCERDQRPVSKLKSSLRMSGGEAVAFPGGVGSEEGLVVQRGEGRIIEDVEMTEVSGDNELQLPGEQSYEVVRLPAVCQTVPEENSSNEQLIEKTRYLLVKTLDLDDHATLSQLFQPSVTRKHVFAQSGVYVDYTTFPDFCFPEGVGLSAEVIGSGYQVMSFILTQEDNSRLYVNCLKFKERLPAHVVDTLPPNCIDRHIRDHSLLFADRAFCLLSRYSHTEFFHGLLEEVFRKYLTQQNSIAMRIRQQQARSEGCIPFGDISFDALAEEFIASYERGLAQVQRELNELQFMREAVKLEMDWMGHRFTFPEASDEAASLFSPRAVHCLFSVLSVQRIAEVFLALLQERKVFFVSDSQIVLGYVIQALLSFLYPLRWEHVILPILPEKLLQLLQAPVPLIAGIPTALASDSLICSAHDTTVVFLDCNEVISREGVEVRQVNHLREAVKRLRIYEIYSGQHVAQMLLLKEQLFLFRLHEKQCESIFSAEHIKHIFFETMLLLLNNYHAFYRTRTSLFSFKRDYGVDDFVRSHPRALHPFMRRFTECTHFINFIYRFADPSPHKRLIDAALRAQRAPSSPNRPSPMRLSEQPNKQPLEGSALRKKVSLEPQHNTTWSPPAKKSEELSTNYSRNLDRFSLKLEDVEMEREREPEEEQRSKGGQICEAITKAMTNASHTKRNVIIWTQARVSRLKRIFGGKHQKEPPFDQPDCKAAQKEEGESKGKQQ